MANIALLKQRNAQRWVNMHINPARMKEFDAAANAYCGLAVKARFQAVTKRLVALGYQPVPWWFIAVVAEREYGRDSQGRVRWDRQLGQGDPLHQVSTHDPRGRGPFLDHPTDTIDDNAWLRCCLDALIECGPYAAKWTDWSVGGVLTLLEEYNGLGYANMGVPSAYVWSGTDQYTSGKYVADHVYRNDVKDVQEGVAPLIARMMAIDHTIVIGSTPSVEEPTKEIHPMSPATTQPASVPPKFHINFHEIEQGLETVAKFLPVVAGFVPQLQPFLTFVPIAEGVLKMVDELQQAQAQGGGSGDFAMIVQNHLHGIAENIKNLVQQHGMPTPLLLKLQQQASPAASPPLSTTLGSLAGQQNSAAQG